MPGVLERIRERVEEIRMRRGVFGERGQIQIGGGALIEKGKEIVNKVTAKVQEVRPGIIPKIGQILAEWYPGKRLTQILTGTPGGRAEIQTLEEYTRRPAKRPEKPPKHVAIHY